MSGRILMLLAALVVASANAEIYRSVAPDGTVVFTDREVAGSRKVDLKPLSTYTPRPLPESPPGAAPEDQAVSAYRSLRISRPAHDATVIDNTGLIEVVLALEPELQVDAGHRIRVALDNTEHDVREPRVQFRNVDRGTHVIRASVVDGKGRTLASAGPVTVHLRRPSRLLPPRKAN